MQSKAGQGGDGPGWGRELLVEEWGKGNRGTSEGGYLGKGAAPAFGFLPHFLAMQFLPLNSIARPLAKVLLEGPHLKELLSSLSLSGFQLVFLSLDFPPSGRLVISDATPDCTFGAPFRGYWCTRPQGVQECHALLQALTMVTSSHACKFNNPVGHTKLLY